MKRILVTLMIGTLAVACGEKKEATVATSSSTTAVTASEAGTATLPEGHPAVTGATASAPAMPGQGTKISGTVVETMDSGGYTYIKVKTASGEEWAATPATKVTKGQNVTIVQQMVAEKFQSNTLKRTFDRIIFGSLEGAAAPAQPGQIATATMGGGMGQMPPGHPQMGGGSPMGSAQQHMTSPAAGDIKVSKAEGADAKTVAEVWAGKGALGGKPVVIHGKVVKFLGGIMGKNWLHLRDGSGSPEKADDDITVTTDDQVSVGDVVTVRGVVSVDKDFGAGYRYPVIVEQAKVSK